MRPSVRPLVPQLAWHVLAILLLLCLPVLKWKAPWWELPRRELLCAAVLIGGYATAALAVLVFSRPDAPRPFIRALGIALGTFAFFMLALLLTRSGAPRYLLLPVFFAVVGLAPLTAAPRRVQIAGIAVLALALLGAGALAGRSAVASTHKTAKVVTTDVTSAFYVLRVRAHHSTIPFPATRGGGLDRLGDRVLLGTGDGRFYALNVAGDNLQARELALRAPANREEFAAAFGGSVTSPRLLSSFAEKEPGVQTWRFRVADVITQVDGDVLRIFASHHFWKRQEQCFVVRVSRLETRLSDIERAGGPGDWQTIFETSPCLPLTGERAMRGKNPFRGEEIGGRLMLLDPNTLLLTVGDQGYSGIEGSLAFAQDPQASYGKTIRIDLRTRASSIDTVGHRNPQGLYAAPDGRIWETEHGPQGGDELNLLVRGANYGWPKATYGVEYGTLSWPFSEQQGQHGGFQQPVYAWLPSVGISNLIQIQHGERFPIWRGDLLIGSLATRGLIRVVLDGDRAVVTEPIPLQHRVRDLLELDDGRVLVWTDEGALLTIEPVTASSAALTFSTACNACHRIAEGLSHRMGPDLRGLLDRPVASADNYMVYTPALKKLGGKWNEQRLNDFLRDPQGAVPGTSMVFPGIEDDRQRAELVEYVMEKSKVGGL
ncbi:MAG TPA: PQQ-dependent sugar dehydrogenase [Steroidobacteraceae bacterium]|nr:PQQ-dependent sugar dehydrogenase [Steroidobacteraceae bacterium]